MEFLTNPIVLPFVFGLVIGIFVGFGLIFLYKLLRELVIRIASVPTIKHLERENAILREALNNSKLPMDKF